ncbi:MAG: metal-dependent hydrolase [Flavobacteriales bacterium]|nr:metal-dependent hydrolase [Flavobacteriales bacterium]
MRQITYYGHSCFLVEMDETSLLFDPFITGNDLAKSIDIKTINPQFILVSHGHGDHVADVESIARQSDAVVVSSYEIASYYGGKNLKYHPINIGGRWDFGKFWVKCVNAVHSSVLPDGTYAGNPMGFVVGNASGAFYYSGDTALHTDMQLIAQSTPVDLAFLCLGDNFTMGISDAASAAKMVGCKQVIGMHFDTFGYIKIDHQRATDHFASAGLTLKLPAIGESWQA